MLDILNYIKNEKTRLGAIIAKKGDTFSPDILSSLNDDLVKLQELEDFIEKSNKVEKVFSVILNTTLENIDDKEDFINLLSEKSEVNVFDLINDNPNIVHVIKKESLTDSTNNNDSITELNNNTVSVSNEFNFEKKNVSEQWAELSDEERKNIYNVVSNLSKQPFVSMELNFLKLICNNGIYKVSDLLKDSKENYLKYQAAIDCLVNKKILEYRNNHENVFLTPLGAWFYGLTFKKNPLVLIEK